MSDSGVARSTKCNDQRLEQIVNNTVRMRDLTGGLSNLVNDKLDELLGVNPRSSEPQPENEATCWADAVIYEQNETIEILSDITERIETL